MGKGVIEMAKEFSDTSFIQFAGWKEEDFQDRDRAFNAALNSYFKLHRMIKHPLTLYIHVKKQNDKHGKKKYFIRCRLNSPGLFFEGKSVKWDFVDAVQDALQTVERETIEKLK